MDDDDTFVLEEEEDMSYTEGEDENLSEELIEIDGVDGEQLDAGVQLDALCAPPVSTKRLTECWSPRTRQQKQQRMIDEIVEVLAVSDSAARVMLREAKWNQDLLKERYFEDAARALRKAGASAPGAPPVRHPGERKVTCAICYSEFTRDAALATGSCEHFFCTPCYGMYIAHELWEKGCGALGTPCPAPNCHAVCDKALVETVLAAVQLAPPFVGRNADLLARYATLQERSFIDDNPLAQWCPAERCGNCVYVPSLTAGSIAAAKASKTQPPVVVTCQCRHSFCFMCLHEDHTPAKCTMVRQWLHKEQDDGNTGNWILANTKSCPGCSTAIEKNEGCNNITCRSCGYSFCWVCEKEWSQHGTSWYQCNFYDAAAADQDEKRDTARQELTRYVFYYTRYMNHDKSKYLERRILEQTEKLMTNMQEAADRSLNAVEYLWDAALQLIRARETLKYTYVYAYYLEGSAQKTLFEYNQAQLEHGTEILSKMLEPKNQLASDRSAVINQQVLVRQSLEKLQQGVYDVDSMAGAL